MAKSSFPESPCIKLKDTELRQFGVSLDELRILADGEPTKTEDRYLKFVRWSEEDMHYVGYCPDLFPWGGVCHGATEEAAYHQLTELVRAEVEDLCRAGKPLPEAMTRPMREAVMA